MEIAIILVTLLVVIITASIIFFSKKRPKPNDIPQNEPIPVNASQAPKSKLQLKKKLKSKAHKVPDHPLIYTILKGNTDSITCAAYSPDGSILAVSSKDRTMRLYGCNDEPEKDPRYERTNLDLDHIQVMNFSEDGKYLVVGLCDSKDLLIYGIKRKKQGGITSELLRKYQKAHNSPILSMYISSTCKSILTASESMDIRLAGLDGNTKCAVKSKLMEVWCVKVDPHFRFVASSGFSSDAIVYELGKDKKTGECNEITKIMTLCGHKSGISCFAFSSDSTKVLTSSKDKSMTMFNIDVRYAVGEDPHVIHKCANPAAEEPCKLIAFSPDDRIVAASTERTLFFMDSSTGKVMEKINDVICNSLSWSPKEYFIDGEKYYFLATGCEDRQTKIWKWKK